mgnify:CR=1 FL=1|jgi:hypothetical protein
MEIKKGLLGKTDKLFLKQENLIDRRYPNPIEV